MTEKKLSNTDKRDLYRLDASLPTRLRIVKRGGEGNYILSEYRDAEGINYSGSGALVLTDADESIEAGSYILMEIRIPGETEEIRSIGEIIRTKPVPVGGTPKLALAVRYLLIDEAAQDTMVKYLINNGGVLGEASPTP